MRQVVQPEVQLGRSTVKAARTDLVPTCHPTDRIRLRTVQVETVTRICKLQQSVLFLRGLLVLYITAYKFSHTPPTPSWQRSDWSTY